MTTLIIIALLPVMGALMDGFQHEGKKLLGSYFKSAFLGVVCYFLVLDLTVWYVLYLLLCWWILFDSIYNKIRGSGLFYVGSTKWTDRLLRWAFRTNAPYFSFITKLMALAMAIGLIFTRL